MLAPTCMDRRGNWATSILSIEPMINEGEGEEEEAARVVGHNAVGQQQLINASIKAKGKGKQGSKKQMTMDPGRANVRGGRDMRTSAFLTWMIPRHLFCGAQEISWRLPICPSRSAAHHRFLLAAPSLCSITS